MMLPTVTAEFFGGFLGKTGKSQYAQRSSHTRVSWNGKVQGGTVLR